MIARLELVERGGIRAVAGLPPAVRGGARDAIQKSGRLVQRVWRAYLSGPGSRTRLAVRSGQLRAHVLYRPVSDFVCVVGIRNVPYARIHEFGGVILPRRARFLVFRLSDPRAGGRGRLVFARRVVIPPRPHAAPTLHTATPLVRQIFQGNIVAALVDARRAINTIAPPTWEAAA